MSQVQFLKIGGGRVIEASHILGYQAETHHRELVGRDGSRHSLVPVLCVTVHLDGKAPFAQPVHYLEGEEAEAFLRWAHARLVTVEVLPANLGPTRRAA